MNKEECMNCEWYGKPYWSIINPCANCNKRFNNKQVKNIKYSINFDKKELYKEIEQLQKENKQLKEKLNKYENPDDMTLMYMWCDEKVKDENKQLQDQLNQALKDYGKELQKNSKAIEFIDDWLFNVAGNGAEMSCKDVIKIKEKLNGDSNEE